MVDADSLAMQLIQLMQLPSERERIGQRALQVVDANRGALARQLEIIKNTVEGKYPFIH